MKVVVTYRDQYIPNFFNEFKVHSSILYDFQNYRKSSIVKII